MHPDHCFRNAANCFSTKDVLAFEIFKKVGNRWAIITIADAGNAQKFLLKHGGPIPLTPLVFRSTQLRCQKSRNKGQPDMVKLNALRERERTLRAKRIKQALAAVSSQPSSPIFPFISFQNGVWEYDHLGKLVFDSKYKDVREGAVTFGKSVLVIYLAAAEHQEWHWHCRIDIPYAIIEHAIPSYENGTRGTITLTLKSPPKIYRIVSTNDLHLYSGREPGTVTTPMPLLDTLSLNPAGKRMQRQCSLMHTYDKNAALCMVYRVTLPDTASAQRAWNHVKKSSAIPQSQCWRTTVPSRPTETIEKEYERVEQALSEPESTAYFTFAVRFQLLALVLEGTIIPTTMFQVIPYVQTLSQRYGPEITARAVRKLSYQIPTPAPDIEARELGVAHIVQTLHQNIKDIKRYEATAEDLSSKQKKHHHLTLTYKATVTPTGLLLRGPELSVSNRVLRKYSERSDYFLRVFFADEDGLSVLHDPRASQEAVYDRFRKVLREGIMIAGRRYTFLGFSHSSLHYHTAWFMAPFYYNGEPLCSKNIIEDMGDFSHIHCSAKCAARIGQAFSDTIFAIPIPKDVYVTETEPDVERNGRCFSDGCGMISQELLEKVWSSLPPERRQLRPTILQIRYRGAKGVVSLDTSLRGKQLLIRKSMTKYHARETWKDLEICGAAYKPLGMYLNQQFIKILEDLGVPRENFISVQQDALKALELIVKHPLNAASFLGE